MNLHALLKRREAVQWDGLCLVVAFLVLLTLIMVWWGIAGSTDRMPTIGQFLPVLLILILYFLLSAATLPEPTDEDALDLRRYYDNNSRYIWTLFLLATLFSTTYETIASAPADRSLGTHLLNRSLDLVVLPVAMLSLIFIKKRWWHWVVLALLSVGPITWLSRSIA
jgi:hypothetical protein